MTTHDERGRIDRRDFAIAVMAIAAGLTIMGASLLQLSAPVTPRQFAQVETGPRDSGKPSNIDPSSAGTPTESKPGGTRPTTPAPQPARPDADARNKGAKPALPPAPAEKSAPPLNAK